MAHYRSYYSEKDTDDDTDIFDQYDPTPYEGGYNMGLTYGRPLQPSEETCYHHSSGSASDNYDEPEFSSYNEPSAYDDEALEEEYSSYARPSYEGDQFRKQRGGSKSESFDDEERTPAGEGGYGRKKLVRHYSRFLYLESYMICLVNMHVSFMCLLVCLARD